MEEMLLAAMDRVRPEAESFQTTPLRPSGAEFMIQGTDCLRRDL